MNGVCDIVEEAKEFMDEYSDVFVTLAQEKQAGEEGEDRGDPSASE